MQFRTTALVVAVGLAVAACGQGNSDNVMAPEANALEPAEVNAALGPEVTNTADINLTANGMNAVDNSAGSAAGEAATNTSGE